MVRREGPQEQLVAQPEADSAAPKGRRAPDIPATPLSASINRLVVVDLPGKPVDDEARRKRASHLLSVPALIRYARERADALRMPRVYLEADPELPEIRQALPRWVDGCLPSPSSDVRAAARGIARRLGRNLGTLVVALHRGDAVNRAARPDWSDAEWDHWQQVRRVWVGGGITSGALGDEMLRHAQEVLVETSCAEALEITRTPYPSLMATLGAGRYLPQSNAGVDPEHALVLDFGQTSVKRAVFTYRRGTIAHVAWLPTQPVLWRWPSGPHGRHDISGQEVLDVVVGTICGSLTDAAAQLGLPVSPDIMMSIAADIDGGAVLGKGVYARMRQLADDVRPLIADGVAAACGRGIIASIMHDGVAAAAVHAGEAPMPSAVILIGTALGVGFPPASDDGLRPIADV